jgi:hypothetical protein
VALLTCGCRCTEDRPYTPFHIEPPKPAVSAGEVASVTAPVASGEAPPLGARPSDVAPKDVSEWTLEGVTLSVAPDRVIERALAADFDGDGQKEAVAWTRARSENTGAETTGELVFMGPKMPSPGRVLAKLPAYMPTGPGCRHTVALSGTGPRTVTLDVAAKCDAARLQRSPTRGVIVLSPAGERATVLELRIADAAPGEAMSLAVDSTDRDGDGRDDVRVSVTLAPDVADAVNASADLVWLDRTAGPSRDSSEPSRSLAAQGSSTDTHSAVKLTGRQIPARIASARRLYATLCAESGTARIFDADGAPFACSGAASALPALLSTEVRNLVTRRDAIGAASALARDGWYEAALPAKQHDTLQQAVLKAFRPVFDVAERTLTPVPRAKSGLPRFSPLTYEEGGALLVQTSDGVVRVDPEGRVQDQSEAMDPWPLAVGVGAAPRWTGIAFPCERSEILLLESDPVGNPLPSKPTELVAPRPGPCRHTSALPTPNLTPIEWTESRQAGFIGGSLFGVTDVGQLSKPAQKGSPRSPNGKLLVTATATGIVLVGTTKPQLWSVPEGAALSDCVVNDGGTSVACVRGDHAVAFGPRPKT